MHHAPTTLFLAVLPQTPAPTAPSPLPSSSLPLEGQSQGTLLGSSGTVGGSAAAYQLNPPPNYFGNAPAADTYAGGISGSTYEGQPHMTTMPDTMSQFK
jgi:hypothetical protein